MTKKSSRTSKANKNNQKRYTPKEYDWMLVRTITSIFLLYMFVLYPLCMHDKYFDITITKYRFFMVGVIFYAFFMLVAVSLRTMDDFHYKSKIKKSSSDANVSFIGMLKKKLMPADIFMGLFLVSGFMAWLMAEDKKAAFTGEMGRRCGLQFMLLVFLMYLCISYGYKLKPYILPIFSVVGSLTYILAIMQHMKIDVFHLLEDVATKQKNSFISTFGNINTFASFLCVALALFMGCFLFEKIIWKKIVYAVHIFLGFAAIITANSDIAYAGCGAAIICLLFIAVYFEKIYEFFQIALLGSLGYTTMAVLIRYSNVETKKLTGFNRIAEQLTILLLIVLITLVITVLCKLIRKSNKKKTEIKTAEIKKKMLITAGIVFVVMLTTIVYGISHHWDIFTFNDKWGTYRGFVWKRLGELYAGFPFMNKLFGNGNESVRALMSEHYYDEMLSLTKTIYDNAHNEYLQYLVTMGIFGVVSYLGFMITVLSKSIQYGKNNPDILVVGLSLFAYLIQAIFNINQSITTPYAFLLAALIIGMCRYERNRDLSNG